MPTMVAMLLALLLTGCAGRAWVPLQGQSDEQIHEDQRVCGQTWLYAPMTLLGLIPLPVVSLTSLAASAALSSGLAETRAQCFRERGYGEVESPVPASPP